MSINLSKGLFYEKIFSIIIIFSLIFSVLAPNYAIVQATENIDEDIIIYNEDDFLYDIGQEDYIGEEQSAIQPRIIPVIVGLVVRTVVINGVKLTKNLYKSIKYAPKYPSGFKAV